MRSCLFLKINLVLFILMGDKLLLKMIEGLIKVVLIIEFFKSDGINLLGVKLVLIEVLLILKLVNWILLKIYVFKFFCDWCWKRGFKNVRFFIGEVLIFNFMVFKLVSFCK